MTWPCVLGEGAYFKAVTVQEKQNLVLSYPIMPSMLWGNG